MRKPSPAVCRTTVCLITAIVAAICVFATTNVSARVDRSKLECEKTKQKISKIQSKMRKGYRASEGVKMDDELRRLRKLRSKQCR